MAFERTTIKKIYYYVICAVTLCVLMWGLVDTVSAVLSVSLFKSPSVSMDAQGGPQPSGGGDKAAASEPFFDEYYQSRMAFDRIGDSVARILVAAALFAYAGYRVRELEGKEI